MRPLKRKEFLKMWEGVGVTINKQDYRRHRGYDWFLYSIHLPYGSADYGRHFAILLVCDIHTGEVIANDEKNTSSYNSSSPAPWSQEIQSWFDRHVCEESVPA